MTLKTLTTVNNKSSLRIISGCFRGRKITFQPTPNELRPTTDRIRETVFNWLQPYLSSAICLDLFAGTGALGLEACSRGAKHVTFVEQNSQIVNHIQDLITQWGITNAKVLNKNTLTYLKEPCSKSFNLIFLDPPFNSNLLTQCTNLLEHNHWLNKDCLIYIELSAKTTWDNPHNWHLLKTKKSGQVCYSLWQK